MGVEECKAEVKAEKKRLAQERTKARRTLQMFKGAAPGTETGTGATAPAGAAAPAVPKVDAKGTEGYQGIFAPSNLQEQAGAPAQDPAPAAAEEPAPAKGTEGYQGIFAPQNLKSQAGADDSGGGSGDGQ